MFSSTTTAFNSSTGSQNVTNGSGNINVVSDNGHQINNRNTTINIGPDTWALVQMLKDHKSKDNQPYRDAALVMWLIQQSDRLSLVPRYHHHNNLDKPVPGTGTWVLDTKEFLQWKDGSSPYRLLFMNGILGSGKSVLISLILESLKKECQDRKEDINCVYLIFHKGDNKAPVMTNIWGSLLLQLLQTQRPEGIASELMTEFEKCLGEELYAPHPSRYLELFKVQARTVGTVYLVIDGLNDCPNSPDEMTQQKLLNEIKGLPATVRTLVTSRTDLGIGDRKDSQRLIVTPRKSDIATYAEFRIKGDISLFHLLEGHKKIEWVTKTVADLASASGMFLLARLHLDTLTKQGTLENIEDALSQLPNNLNHAFEGAKQQILKKHDFDRELARHVLTWISHAKADLTIEQIRDSFAIRTSKRASWEDMRPPKDSLVSVCAGLVVQDTTKGTTKCTVRFIHESVKCFVIRKKLIYDNAEHEIAKTSLLCLLANGETPLLEYASIHWIHHCPDFKDIDTEMETQIRKFFLGRDKLMRAFRTIPDTPGRNIDGMTGLHAAVFYNLRAWAEELIDSCGVDINEQCSDGQTPLHWAVALGRSQLVDELIKKRAINRMDINRCDNSKDAPIHKCLSGSAARNLDIVRRLIDGGSKLDVEGSKGLTPLSLAIRYGPTSVAKELIKSQKDVNAEVIMTGWTMLRELLYHGHEMGTKLNQSSGKARHSSADGWESVKRAIDNHGYILLRLLLEKGADLNRPSTTDKWLPLIHAVKTGQAETVRALLDREPNPANVNLPDFELGKSPLRWAFEYKRSAIVRHLVRAGSNLNEENHDGWTPLIEAVKNQDQDLVWLMLREGAHRDAIDGQGWSALHHAVKNKSSDITWLLITHGARGITQNEHVPTLLEVALAADDLPVAWLLYAHGASIDAVDKSGMTVLHKACIEGNLSHVKFLLDMGSKFNTKDLSGSTPLHYSVLQGREEVVDFLASRAPHPADLDHKDGKENTALTLATMLKNQEIMSSLLRHGASCDIQGQHGLTALHRAANMGFNDGLTRLVAKTGNINLADNRGYTALHHAVNSEKADTETVKILCTGGAKVEVKQEHGYTPRQLAGVLGKEGFALQLLAYEGFARRAQLMGNDGTRKQRNAG
ncbi:hypothetical protein CDV36_013001 [Fusarium kuroshium]|uniref:NACHT domain-containing protein n=1 Tax=Fusarium kuroshium TaxID=2010991 RepID=A0A3M2RRD4_9HYPO|nr:hypothetical protein CDV36_013001 [Fusarium kuroshium]